MKLIALFRNFLSSLNLPIPVLQLSHTQPLTLPERWSCSRTTLLVIPAMVLFEQIGHSKGSFTGFFLSHLSLSALDTPTPSISTRQSLQDGRLTDLLFFAFWFLANSVVFLSLWQTLQIFLENPSPVFLTSIISKSFLPRLTCFQILIKNAEAWFFASDFMTPTSFFSTAIPPGTAMLLFATINLLDKLAISKK